MLADYHKGGARNSTQARERWAWPPQQHPGLRRAAKDRRWANPPYTRWGRRKTSLCCGSARARGLTGGGAGGKKLARPVRLSPYPAPSAPSSIASSSLPPSPSPCVYVPVCIVMGHLPLLHVCADPITSPQGGYLFLHLTHYTCVLIGDCYGSAIT